MSGLTDLLAGRLPTEVYRWTGAVDLADLRLTVEHAGWRFAAVDGWAHHTKAGFLVAVGESLAFPDWYGANLDAFADCLRDVSGAADAGTILVWDGWGPLAGEDPHTFGVVLDILTDRAAGLPPFGVLMGGEGPPVDVPELGE